MKWTTGYCLICTFLSGIFSTETQSQVSVFRTADSLMKLHAYREASVELEKALFFHGTPEVKTAVLLKKAECYKHLHLFEKSLETLNRIFLPGEPVEIVFQVRYEKALVLYLGGQPGRSLAELELAAGNVSGNEEDARRLFLQALCQCELNQWEEARKSVLVYLNGLEADSATLKKTVTHLEELFSRKKLTRQLSPGKAKTISMFIPGGGQFYAGKIGEGLFSFGLHGTLFFFGIHQFANKFYFTGYTAGFGLFQRIYTGNLQRVQDLVNEVNAAKKDKFLEELMAILTEI